MSYIIVFFQPSAFFLGDVCVPPMANVLKVFLENGQTKSFKYDAWTTVQDVVTSLQDKLCLRATEHFSLVVEHIKSLKRNKLTLLNSTDTLARVSKIYVNIYRRLRYNSRFKAKSQMEIGSVLYGLLGNVIEYIHNNLLCNTADHATTYLFRQCTHTVTAGLSSQLKAVYYRQKCPGDLATPPFVLYSEAFPYPHGITIMHNCSISINKLYGS